MATRLGNQAAIVAKRDICLLTIQVFRSLSDALSFCAIKETDTAQTLLLERFIEGF